ncbi:MAG: hypothetical protein OZSIB_2474 [Candidatus Ozemobacter sibiricus]|jgi:Tfp pilus assembly protein PilO|uniref:Type IV pilus biogenesis protein PilO n=1 Tax=Candidatus Ozemobacter sibiricus TaxID=2268124 RepID=A0A367ZTC2_9BACT|nr:MAG: hypothetical protein OZSIB_2474 [Candidatus Ozemobacter sibiricus]
MKTRMRSILERVISYGLIVAALIGFMYFQGSVDKNQKAALAKKANDLAQLKARIEEGQKQFAERQKQIEGIMKTVQARQAELESFERRLGKTANYTQFIDQVQRKAQNFGIAILNFQCSRPAPVPNAPPTYLEFGFTMNVTGAYEQMKHFLWELENSMGRLTKVANLVIKPPICDKEGKMNLTLTLKTYFIQ